MRSNTIIYCGPDVERHWPNLARQWAVLYPGLFDAKDVQLTRTQPKNHFAEWFAAIHLFHRDGSLSLIEKYHCRSHREKFDRVNQLGPAVMDALQFVRRALHVQPPDLLLYDMSRLRGFAEVKGPHDKKRPSDRQLESHRELERRLGVQTEVIEVRLTKRAG